MKTARISTLIALIALAGSYAVAEDAYKPDWDSLAKHNEAPEWLKDAKFGIYFHWGVYSVPAYQSPWYGHRMYIKRGNVYKHHLEKYGDPNTEFPYHKFVPMFKAEHFDADEWAELFQQAGARFAGPVAEHHDGFAMWDSDATPWNAADMGPKRDITGELEKALKKRGMKFITTMHHGRHLTRYQEKKGKMERYGHFNHVEHLSPEPNTEDIENFLYGNLPPDFFHEKVWLAKLKELVDQYSPDIIWFDSWLQTIPEEYHKRFCAYYLNEAKKKNQEVVIVRKQNDLPLEVSINDHEQSREDKLIEELWMSDITITLGNWSYQPDQEIKTTDKVMDELIDIVSKNGVLLLNLSPKADGTIPDSQKKVILEMGEWLKANGEAIYGTRPWYTYGEGPTREPEGGLKNKKKFLALKYTARDVRYTTKGNVIYAILLAVPAAGEQIEMASFRKGEHQVERVETLTGAEVKWAQADALTVTAPEPDNTLNVVYKITLR